MITLSETPVNKSQAGKAQAVWLELLAAATRRGFFGTVSVEVSVQDGTIQRINSKVEKVEK
jgi:hypothetical protein